MILESFVFSLFNKEIQKPIMRDLICISTGVIPSSAYIIYMGVLFLRWVIVLITVEKTPGFMSIK